MPEEQEVPVPQASREGGQRRPRTLAAQDQPGLPGVHLLYLQDAKINDRFSLLVRYSRCNRSENEPSEVEVSAKPQDGRVEPTHSERSGPAVQ